MTVRAVEYRSTSQNQLDRRPRVFASRDRVHVEGDKPTLQNGVDFTTTTFQGTADKAADVFCAIALVLRHTRVLCLRFLRASYASEFIDKLGP